MRGLASLLLLLAGTLAGCLDETAAPPQPLLGLCPQWVQGPGFVPVDLALAAGEMRVVRVVPPGADPVNRTGPGWVFHGRSLDLVRLQFSYAPAASLSLRATRGSDASLLGILDYRDGRHIVPSIAFAASPAADEPFDVILTAISQNEPPAPGPVELRFTAQSDTHLVGNVTFHYRVCGADV
jgi:hypothetical protein